MKRIEQHQRDVRFCPKLQKRVQSTHSKRFENVQTPMDARPGDILTSKGHVRLVARMNAMDNGSVVLGLAESTSARDIPKGREIEENDIGPRMIQVQYAEPERPICEQSPVQMGPEERFTPNSDESSYILGRLKKSAWDAL